MPRYLLDTNICIYIGKNQPIEVRQKFEQLQANDIAISVITYGELRYGAQKSQSCDKALKVINQLTSVIQILPLDENAGGIMAKYVLNLLPQVKSLVITTCGLQRMPEQII